MKKKNLLLIGAGIVAAGVAGMIIKECKKKHEEEIYVDITVDNDNCDDECCCDCGTCKCCDECCNEDVIADGDVVVDGTVSDNQETDVDVCNKNIVEDDVVTNTENNDVVDETVKEKKDKKKEKKA